MMRSLHVDTVLSTEDVSICFPFSWHGLSSVMHGGAKHTRHHRMYTVCIIKSSALALHCYNGYSKINRKMKILTPGRIATPQKFYSEIRQTWTYPKHDPTCKFWSMSVRRGVLHKYVKYNKILWLFDCSYFFLDPVYRSIRGSGAHAQWLKRRVSAQGGAFCKLEWRVMPFGGNMP